MCSGLTPFDTFYGNGKADLANGANGNGDEDIFPPGMVKFQDSDVLQVLDIYQEISALTQEVKSMGRNILCSFLPSDNRYPRNWKGVKNPGDGTSLPGATRRTSGKQSVCRTTRAT